MCLRMLEGMHYAPFQPKSSQPCAASVRARGCDKNWAQLLFRSDKCHIRQGLFAESVARLRGQRGYSSSQESSSSTL